MTINAFLQIVFFLAVLFALAKWFSGYMTAVFEDKKVRLTPFLGPIEKGVYRFSAIDSTRQMNWQTYACALLLFNFFGFIVVYLLQRWQAYLPLNPSHFGAVQPSLAFNTAISFVTNTNWQAYHGETTLSYFTQMAGLTVQNFVSATTDIGVLLALIRGIVAHESENLGNFWVDLTRSTLYIFLPLSLILSLLLVSQGVVQSFKPYQIVPFMEKVVHIDKNKVNLPLLPASKSTTSKSIKPVSLPSLPVIGNSAKKPNENPVDLSSTDKNDQAKEHVQIIPLGPAASQIAIKQLGSNGGGFFGANSAHPFENPTPLANFLELLALLLVPVSLCFTFGQMIRDKRQGWAIFAAMTIIFIPLVFWAVHLESTGNSFLQHAVPALNQKPVATNTIWHHLSAGGNMEGKEVRLGAVNSALWAVSTTAVSNGAVNASLDSFTPMGGLIPMWFMQLGEVIYGGVGSGIYGMIVFVLLTVFIAGLMVGRTPEYLGKKIEVFEMKMSCLAILMPHFSILLFTALAVVSGCALASLGNSGAHGFSEILYAFTSAANNNGSAFAGLKVNTPFFNILTGLAMCLSRFWIIVAVLAIAGSLARKKVVPISQGTMPTHTPLFIGLLIGIVLIIGALSFFPALSLGPIIEHLQAHTYL